MMDKVFKPSETEEKIYKMWEAGGYFTPKIPARNASSVAGAGGDPSKRPFTIILPLPNANDPMHMGHTLFTVEDILVRYHRMRGEPTLWLPGGDHAGIETQYVFEKHLAKEGKSRFDYDRNTLYQMIKEFAEKNRDLNKNQMKQLGFSLDWTRYHYSLEPEIVERVLETFVKLHQDGLVYRGEKIVNFCTHCGTAFSELEVNYVERESKLYYLDYGPLQIATTRPETIFADVAVAVSPQDKRYQSLIGKEAKIPLISMEVPIITSDEIDAEFGTGALKVTPGYDPVDFEIGQKNNLPILSIIDRQGRMVESARVPKELAGLKVAAAREKTVEMLKASGRLVKEQPLTHSVGTCYRCGTTIEPMVIPQWFVKTKQLAQPAIEAVKKGKTKIVPGKRFEKMYFDWMENIKDWNISRQIVWGPRLPIWYNLDENPSIQINFISKGGNRVAETWSELSKDKEYNFNEIKEGLQSLIAPKDAIYYLTEAEALEKGEYTLQETDTFDTWFLSGQWPVNALRVKPGDFEYFYPTSVLDTLWDILFFWVGRMMMFGLYLTGQVPFRTVHIHSRVVDKEGRKMSKSKGNVLDPITMVQKYGADALRMALVLGVAPASDIAISEEKIKGQRNFTNKVWNIARFIQMNLTGKNVPFYEVGQNGLQKEDEEILAKLNDLVAFVTKDLNNFHFGEASQSIYQFVWHEFADKYIELSKARLQHPDPACPPSLRPSAIWLGLSGDCWASSGASRRGSGSDNGGLPGPKMLNSGKSEAGLEDTMIALSVLRHVLLTSLKLLHPFMPFVTEAIWQQMPRKGNEPLIISKWPKTNV